MSPHRIDLVGAGDVGALVPLMEAYCGFYEQTEKIPPAPADALEDLARALVADPERHGVQLLARRESDGTAVGFATVYWTWSTIDAARIAVLYDLYVAPSDRGSGLAEALIAAARDQARRHGVRALTWTTAPGNARAQAVYDRLGASRSTWIEYELPV
ncbi:GNAT family N-acetyltransferase [Patulibacter defluvii]|uniref:GNAT family N-acetyltransferase n=1 Tax=Patulibacter defluvii TaxID=3095358 RepID=UPI002A74B109|nr:GNAT family N-acetyltransferase [Patulibacter sp. DM4]